MGESAIEVMLRHRSIRRFTEEPVGEALLREIVECGLRASNTGNMQLYSVIATREEPRRSQLLQLHYGQCATAPLLRWSTRASSRRTSAWRPRRAGWASATWGR